VSLGEALQALPGVIDSARRGDRAAEKQLLFAYRYGMIRDEVTGQFRPYTEAEIEQARARLLGPS
jgi:hypothetical protein